MVYNNSYLGATLPSEISKKSVNNQPITVYKRNYLHLGQNNYVSLRPTYASFVGMEQSRKYIPLDADAQCMYFPDTSVMKMSLMQAILGKKHQILSSYCMCGFYGYRDIMEAIDHAAYQRSAVVLEVAVSGEFEEYEKGYRFAHQRVKNIFLAECEDFMCARPATRFLPDSHGNLLPLCSSRSHFVSNKNVVTASELTEYIRQSLGEGYPAVSIKSVYDNITMWERNHGQEIIASPKKWMKFLGL